MQEASAELDVLNKKLDVQKKVVAEKQAASNILLAQVKEGMCVVILFQSYFCILLVGLEYDWFN